MAKTFNKQLWLIRQLRRLSLKYPPRISALNRTKKTYYIKSKHGKDLKRVSWTCELCGKTDLKNNEKEVDHKIPVVDINTGFNNIGEFIDRLFCDKEGLQVICIPCHEAKTKEQLEERVKNRKNV